MYEYGPQETAAVVAREVDDGAAAARDLLPAELRMATFCWGYRPTLIPPATVLGDVAAWPDERDGLRHFSSGRSRAHKSAIVVRERGRCLLELLMERMRKRPQRGAELAASVKNRRLCKET
ncbi:uncharacterized protein LOC111258295 [Setaria italica]|uniref:uncharacterized protein LOC111258295 n=1 Tax=Setaria italica TaxID=4555 RepID=UPI000BE4E403|nr:uncharacterized protein LOC111258295 [Setaria italica]